MDLIARLGAVRLAFAAPLFPSQNRLLRVRSVQVPGQLPYTDLGGRKLQDTGSLGEAYGESCVQPPGGETVSCRGLELESIRARSLGFWRIGNFCGHLFVLLANKLNTIF